jgi:pimeloyl-ACP methyl ester carboxylesterase
VLALSGCALTLSEADVFAPQRAAQNTVTINDDAGLRIEDNVAQPGLWAELGYTFTASELSVPSGRIALQRMERADAQGPLIVYCGGTAFDWQEHGAAVSYFLGAHGDLLFWNYPGYGGSDGAPSVANLRNSFPALADEIARQRGPDQPLILWGHSLGGFVCAELAARLGGLDGLDAVILEASAPSATAAARYLPGPLLRGVVRPRLPDAMAGLDVVRALSSLDVPVLVLGGGRDDVLPVRLSQQLADGLQGRPAPVQYEEFADADHFTISWQDGFPEVVEDFIGSLREDRP